MDKNKKTKMVSVSVSHDAHKMADSAKDVAYELTVPPQYEEDRAMTAATFDQLVKEAEAVSTKEPMMSTVFFRYIFARSGLGNALSYVIADAFDGIIPATQWQKTFMQVYDGTLGPYEEQMGSVEWLATCDLRAVPERDSATEDVLTPFLHYKGFKAIQAHRLSHVFWRKGMTQLALTVQQRISECWGVDIHPACVLGGGMLIDHATGVVIGSTARVGYGCTFLHSTTLGATGKEAGDRHPKLGNNVMVGQGSSTLGNIRIGDNTKIGALSMVLKDMPADATVVGNPAKVVRISTSSKNVFSSKAMDRIAMIARAMGTADFEI